MSKKVLITGWRGYLGSVLMAELSTSGFNVTGLPGRLGEIDPGSLDFDFVVHSAGALRHRPDEHMLANAEGTRSLVEGLVRPTPIVYISSRGVYRDQYGELLSESSPTGPDDSYGQSKLLGEQIILESGYPSLMLRSSTLVGWGVDQAGRSFLGKAVQNVLNGQAITRYLPDRSHDNLYVWDAARIVHWFLNHPASIHGIYNMGGPRRSLHALFDLIASVHREQTDTTPVILEKENHETKSTMTSHSLMNLCGVELTSDSDVVAGLHSALKGNHTN